MILSLSHLFAETVIKGGSLTMRVAEQGFRYSFDRHVAAHPQSGLVIGGEPVGKAVSKGCRNGVCQFLLPNAAVSVTLSEHHVWMRIKPSQKTSVMARTAGASPGYGLGDHTAYKLKTTDITGYQDDQFSSYGGQVRLVSNFAIYPEQAFAVVLFDPWPKIVHSTEDEIAQGSRSTSEVTDLHYFFGKPQEIYFEYLKTRNERGYPVMLPKYEFFGVGWEAFGALGWDTNQRTITESIDRYLDLGYPLRWMVVGSGFWPKQDPKFHETTSFGMYDPDLYPDPKGFIEHFHQKGLRFFHGLRISFIVGGPFTDEGLRRGFFLEKIYQLSWPKSPCYLLDAQNPEAVKWYLSLVKKWTDYGVDGFKEDLYGWKLSDGLRDDKLDPVDAAQMKAGQYLMGRNAYIGSPCDLHRINDFNYNQNQDRGPINSAAIAYSGFPLVYPDIVGGTFGERHFDTTPTPRMRTYIMRNAQWASVHPSMSMGQPPWEFRDPKVEKVMLAAARLHDRLHPYFYSQAVRWHKDGYPWTFAPLPLAYPRDPQVHNRENTTVRGYQWMIGDALMATPLYGDDYETAAARDVYLPAGVWIDYDTGEKFTGPTTLKSYALPPGKTPLFAGGTGIVIEQQGAALVGRVYPVATKSETVFWHKDAATQSKIRVAVEDWKTARVVETTSRRPVSSKWVRHALEFPFEPGRDYTIN